MSTPDPTEPETLPVLAEPSAPAPKPDWTPEQLAAILAWANCVSASR